MGCELKHLASSLVLLEEARGYEQRGEHGLRDKHLFEALGNLMQAEAQAPLEEHQKQIREVRKRIESAMASGGSIPNLGPELERKGTETLELLRKSPELCPTCQLGEIEHV